MRASLLLLPPLALLRLCAAEIYPLFQSFDFDNGTFGPYPNRTYVTQPTFTSPQLNIQLTDSRCDDGLYTMISLRGDRVKAKAQSPMIFDAKGHLVWMDNTYGETFGLGVQRYKGVDYLTFWQGDDSVGGHGEGYYFLVSTGWCVWSTKDNSDTF